MSEDQLHPIYKAMLDHLTPPRGQGNDYFVANWSMLLALLPFLPFLLGLLSNSNMMSWILFGYSILVIYVHVIVISSFKKSMQFISNPFDFVKVQFINLILVVVSFGLANYFLWRVNHSLYNGNVNSVLDMIYYSAVTITTVGYGDISAATTLGRILSITEIFVGMWFVVTVIPVAVADQAERLRHLRTTRNNVVEEFQRAMKRGEVKLARPISDQHEEEQSDENS